MALAVELGSVVALLLLSAWVIAAMERVMIHRLARRFGWSSLMITGWLGAPIHEASHALVAIAFGHQLQEVAWFRPDSKTGRLGYVRHTYLRGHWIQEIGNFFIALAPLAGGSLALCAGMWMCFPRFDWLEFLDRTLQPDLTSLASLQALSSVGEASRLLLGRLLAIENFSVWRFWIFIYLAICVAAHMAPSAADYRNARFASMLLAAAGVIVVAAGSLFDWSTELLQRWILFFAPVAICLLTAGAIFAVFAAVMTLVFTALWDALTTRRPLKPPH